MLGLHLICFTLEQTTSALTIAAFFAPGVSDESWLNCGSALGLIGWVIMIWHKQRAELINHSQANDIDKQTPSSSHVGMIAFIRGHKHNFKRETLDFQLSELGIDRNK